MRAIVKKLDVNQRRMYRRLLSTDGNGQTMAQTNVVA